MTPRPDQLQPRSQRSPGNPLFPKSRRRRSLPSPLADLALIAGLAIILFFVSLLPPFRITTIVVTGQEKLNPAYVVEQTRQQLQQNILGLLPRNVYFYVNPVSLAQTLRQRLSQIVLLDDLSVAKRFPRTLLISVKEGKPAAILSTPAGEFALDHSGRLIGPAPTDLPEPTIIKDDNGLRWSAGDAVIHQTIMDALPELRALDRQGLGPATFRTPRLRCPLDAGGLAEETAPEIQPQNVNTAVNQNVNRGAVPPPLLEQACDLKGQLQKSTIIEVGTNEGWYLVVDAALPTGDTLRALNIALEGKLKERQGLRQIDLRFLPRVFYQ